MTEKENQYRPVISFIIPDYNLPIQLIRECIESILALDINADEREIILVDDGSDVLPAEGISDLMPFISYIRQNNQGLSAARNTGIENSHGLFIQFVDGDDCLLPSYNDCLATITKGGFDILFFDWSNEKKAAGHGRIIPLGEGKEYMLHNNIRASAWGYVFRRELIAEGLRFTKGILHEDEEFTPLLILKAENAARYDAPAYFYRVREDSIVHCSDTKHLERRFRDFTGVIKRLGTTADSLNGDSRKALKRRVSQLVMDHIYNVAVLTRDKDRVDEAMARLREQGLLPLPIKAYTLKYLAFSMLVRYRIGYRILIKYLTR